MPPHPVTAYAKAVVDNKIVAGPHVRAACKRHLDDLANGAKSGLHFDHAAADRAIGFFADVLRLNGGDYEGKPFILADWQQFIVGSLMGWKASDGYRRFRMAFVETSKGSGKSPLAAGIGLYMLLSDGEARAEVYAAASKKDQAIVLFRDAVAMVRQSPHLAKRLQFSGGPTREYNIAHLQTGSFFRPISSDDGQSGPRPYCALLDEIHEHRDNTMVELLRAGVKSRRQALIFMITNSGADRTGVCYQYHDYAAKIAAQTIADDAFFSFVCGLDEDDDPFKDEACWPKANPSLPTIPGHRYIREQVTQAFGMPAKEGVVRRLNFSQWTDSISAWIDRDCYEACLSDFDPDELCDLPCYLGLDLSSKRDLTALAACWKHDDGSLSLAAWGWTPGDTMDERSRIDNVPYRTWADQGWLFAPNGRIIDKRHVAEFVRDFCAKHDVQTLAFDQAMLDDFQVACDDIGFDTYIDDGKSRRANGVRMVRHGQGYAGYASTTSLWMPRSISSLEEYIIKHRIRILPSPVLRYCNASAVLESDPSGNRKWEKRRSTGRIDLIVAACMAVGMATSQMATTSAKPFVSIFDDENLFPELYKV